MCVLTILITFNRIVFCFFKSIWKTEDLVFMEYLCDFSFILYQRIYRSVKWLKSFIQTQAK